MQKMKRNYVISYCNFDRVQIYLDWITCFSFPHLQLSII